MHITLDAELYTTCPEERVLVPTSDEHGFGFGCKSCGFAVF